MLQQKLRSPRKKTAAQVEEPSSTAQEPQKSGAETPAEAAPAAAQNMTQAQSEEAKAVEAKLAENAPVKSDSVTFTAVLPVVTPEMSSVQGARPQEDEEAADALTRRRARHPKNPVRTRNFRTRHRRNTPQHSALQIPRKNPRAGCFHAFRKAPVTWIFHSIRLVVLCGIDRTRARRVLIASPLLTRINGVLIGYSSEDSALA